MKIVINNFKIAAIYLMKNQRVQKLKEKCWLKKLKKDSHLIKKGAKLMEVPK